MDRKVYVEGRFKAIIRMDEGVTVDEVLNTLQAQAEHTGVDIEDFETRDVEVVDSK